MDSTDSQNNNQNNNQQANVIPAPMPTPVPMPLPLPMTQDQWQAPGKLLLWLVKTLSRPIPAPQTTTDTQTETGETATVYAWNLPNQSQPHFSIQVNGLHTEQIITDTEQNTTMAMFRPVKGAGLIAQVNVPLSNAAVSNAYQKANLGADTGQYNKLTNNCLTTCVDVLSAGGSNIARNQLINMLKQSRGN